MNVISNTSINFKTRICYSTHSAEGTMGITLNNLPHVFSYPYEIFNIDIGVFSLNLRT